MSNNTGLERQPERNSLTPKAAKPQLAMIPASSSHTSETFDAPRQAVTAGAQEAQIHWLELTRSACE